jgi:glycogen synthase
MTTDTVGGVWTYVMELTRALGNYGIEIALATMGAPLSPNQRTEAASLWNVKIFESHYKLEWMNDAWDEVDAAGEWLMKLEDQFQPDIVHLNNFSHGALPWRAPKIVVGHSCVLSWWRATKGCKAPPEWDTYFMRVKEGLRLADFVIAPSKTMLTSLEQHYGPFAGSAVIPNGRSILRNRRRTKRNFILCAGRLWDEAKNVATLAKSALNLSWPVYVAGEKREPHGRAKQHSQVRHLGHLPQSKLQAWFERAAIFAAPARYEPFGLSIFEAALAGCALALGDIPSLRENWNDAALFVPPEDSRALEAALEKLIRSPQLRRELSAKAMILAHRFTPERMAENYLMTYSNILARSSGSINAMAILSATEKEPGLAMWKGVSCAL